MQRFSSLYLFFLLSFLLPFPGFAESGGRVSAHIMAVESRGTRFEPVSLFAAVEATGATDALWSSACYKASVLRFDQSVAADLLGRRPAFIRLALPSPDGPVLLDLEKVDITTSDFRVVQASDGLPVRRPEALHYQGMVRGEGGSIAAISIFPDRVMGLLADADGQRVLGALENAPAGLHVFYRERDLRRRPGAHCDVREVPGGAQHPAPAPFGERTTRCVNFYWEVDHDIFLNKGSVTAATNYVTGLFNQSSILYAKDGVDVALSEVFVWDVTSPYTSNDSGDLLDQFGAYRTSFNGDLAHLLALRGGGGIAWLGTLCNSQTRYRMAFSGIGSSYNNVPTYSWSVEVVTHEQGHNMGSPHTHACAWNGDNTAIDGCGPAAGYSEGGCPDGPIPSGSVGGTIMSYCHLVSGVGINFNNGFGPQPTALIVGNVNAATCLSACGTSCDPPSGLIASPVTTTTATLGWAATGVSGYTLQWRLSPSGAWATVTGLTNNSYDLTGLVQGTDYDFRVLSECGSNSSAYSATYTFTTAVPCPDAMEPNDSRATAGTVGLPASVDALIATASDQDYYAFTLSAASDLYLTLSNLAGDYDLELQDNSGAQVGLSQNGGTSSESISLTGVAAGTYYAHVYGYSGAHSSDQCYHFSVQAFVQECPPPTGLSAQNITYNSADLSWSAVQGVTDYTLRWKKQAESTWNNVPGINGTSYVLNGLEATTDYEFQVAASCSGTNPLYSASEPFTTIEVPCDVAPRIVLDINLLLQGPYNEANGLMNDVLRAGSLLPTTEPYTAAGYPVEGPLTVAPAVFGGTGAMAVVDWVLVELRNASAPATVEERRVGLLHRNGTVTALDGSSMLGFCSDPGNYRVAVRHRNHLGCMSATLALSATATSIDFTLPGTATYGTNARKAEGGVMLLWSGDTSDDAIVSYTGGGNDRDVILQEIGGNMASATVIGYFGADVNMDGTVMYTGAGNDRDPILQNIGGTMPSATVQEQLP